MYKPHWQLLPPRHPLPPSLRPINNLLTSPSLLKLVLHIMTRFSGISNHRTASPSTAADQSSTSPPARAAAAAEETITLYAGTPIKIHTASYHRQISGTAQLETEVVSSEVVAVPLSEETLLPALNLLSLSLHHVAALLQAEDVSRQQHDSQQALTSESNRNLSTPACSVVDGTQSMRSSTGGSGDSAGYEECMGPGPRLTIDGRGTEGHRGVHGEYKMGREAAAAVATMLPVLKGGVVEGLDFGNGENRLTSGRFSLFFMIQVWRQNTNNVKATSSHNMAMSGLV